MNNHPIEWLQKRMEYLRRYLIYKWDPDAEVKTRIAIARIFQTQATSVKKSLIIENKV